MNCRTSLCLLALLFAAAWPVDFRVQAASPRLNVLFIATDDLNLHE